MPDTPEEFIARWLPSGGSERANYGLFLSELCEVLGVERPGVSTAAGRGTYVLEREVTEVSIGTKSTQRWIDFYAKGRFIIETKQGVEKEEKQEAEQRAKEGRKERKKRGHGIRGTEAYDRTLIKAKAQAEAYARLLPAEEGRPPFVLVIDVGHVIEVYSEFSLTGGNYLPFPNATQYRIPLAKLADQETRDLLRTIWTDPMSLDPSRRAALATREVAARLAGIGKSLSEEKNEKGRPRYSAQQISAFLMRMIFTMFAEDMDLLPRGKFTEALRALRDDVSGFEPLIGELWQNMATGGRSGFLRAKVLHFNGGLFESVEVLPVTAEQLELLIGAAECDWSQVEPSIFGTLVERALNTAERHRLGAHYTPRAYVERLVERVVIEPLRQDWGGVLVAVEKDLSEVTAESSAEDQTKARQKAVAQVEAFLADLRGLRVLDPACGTGNFLYVSMELIKTLEGEVQTYLTGLGGQTPLLEVSPENFLGLELNPRAASVASLVLWIGYLQIYARGHTRPAPPEPVLKAFKNIRQMDAVLGYKKTETNPQATRWDGETRIKDPVTGRMLPDPNARVQDVNYLSPFMPPWPIADFIVGNPPFIGAGPMRETLGDGYVKALRKLYKISKHHPGVPDSANFVMYWWFRAAQLMDVKTLRRFGFVTTHTIKQTFNRRVIEEALTGQPARPLSLLYAVPDHPWVDEAESADIDIAMTVVGRGLRDGVIAHVVDKTLGENGEYIVETKEEMGRIHSNLTIGADVTAAVALEAMRDLSNPGVKLHGNGFIVPRQSVPDAKTGRKETDAVALGLNRIPGLEKHIRQYRHGRDLNQTSRGMMVIDLFGLTEDEVRTQFPEVYQHVKATVKPERDQNNRASRRKKWWLFGEPNPKLRDQLDGLPRYIATVETSKHRTFQFLDAAILPDNMLIAIAHDDAYVLGVLSSRIHTVWALVQGGDLGPTPRYNKTRCFETFPFPAATPAQQQAIRNKAEELDAHRKQRLTLDSDLTLTGLYNVLERLRAHETLTDDERDVNTSGLVKILKELHDELDALVAAAYGWPADLPAPELLEKLAALNAVRAAEERQDIVQYLRPRYQNPEATVQGLLVEVEGVAAAAAKRPAFPKKTKEQSQAVRQLLRDSARPLTPGQIAGSFTGVGEGRIEDILSLMEGVGQVREVPGLGGYIA